MTVNLPIESDFAIRQSVLRLHYHSRTDQEKLWRLLEQEPDPALKMFMICRINPNSDVNGIVFWTYKKDEESKVHCTAFNRLKLISNITDRKEAYRQVSTWSGDRMIKKEASKRFDELAKISSLPRRRDTRSKPAFKGSAQIIKFPR